MTALDTLIPGQALIDQQSRLLKLSTPLGDDILLPQRVVGHDVLGRDYAYTVDCLAVRDTIDLDANFIPLSEKHNNQLLIFDQRKK